MRALLPCLVCCLAAAGCAHPTGEKGGLVSVKASADEVQKAFSGRRFALLIGIPQSADEHWQPLRFATKDVDDLGAVLQDPLRGRFARVESLTTPEQTTRAAVEAAIARLAALATQPDDVRGALRLGARHPGPRRPRGAGALPGHLRRRLPPRGPDGAARRPALDRR